MNLPEAWIRRMRTELRDEMPAFLNEFDKPALRGIRMNPEKPVTGLREWDEILDAVPWEKQGFYLREDSLAGTTVMHEAGAFYLQEPSAMIPGAVMDARPGERILDLCAAPGGKATQMGLAMGGRGVLVANEPVEKRAKILSRNIERMGIPNAVVTCARPEELAEKWEGFFDGVMVDAPCSGEGMFRRNPESRGEWSEENAAGCAARQREILRAAVRMVRPGGRMVYSTCTWNPEENEDMIRWLLDTFPEFRMEGFELEGIDGRTGHFTCYPHRCRGEGQFAARLRRAGGAGESEAGMVGDSGLPRADREALKGWRNDFPWLPEATHRLGNTLVRLEDSPPLQGIRILRAGLHLGEIRGKIVIPDHAAAMAWPAAEGPVCETDEKEALKYLAGETLEKEQSGWTVVRFRGLSLGWGKGSGGILRNHYPKGLRNQLLHV